MMLMALMMLALDEEARVLTIVCGASLGAEGYGDWCTAYSHGHAVKM
jgi:hypothetical protein